MMIITVNGQRWTLPDGAMLADLLERLGAPPRGIAIAVNGAVIPRASWPGTPLRDGASIDVVTAVQGG